MSDIHTQNFQVRDYECDLQGVVNNAVYQNYLEHARHELLRARGIDFAGMSAAGINLIVVRAELDYRKSLVSGDRFCVRSRMQQTSKLRFEFIQDIYRLPDETVIMNARIIGTALNERGRPFMPDWLQGLLGNCY